MPVRPPFRLLAGIALLFTAHGAYAVTTLTMTTEYPATSMPGQGVSTFAELVRAKTAGNVVIDATYDASKGIKSGDMIDAVETRKVDAGDAFAGALAAKKRLPVTSGTMPTHGPLFVTLLIGTVLLVGLLNYVPSLALGPIVEHLMLWAK